MCASAMQACRSRRAAVAVRCAAVEPKKILMMGACPASSALSSSSTKPRHHLHGQSTALQPPSHTHPTLTRMHAHALPHAGGTRFIGVYLARQLVEQGHEVHLFTRGKTPTVYPIPDDTGDSYYNYSTKVKHIAGDRMVSAWTQHS